MLWFCLNLLDVIHVTSRYDIWEDGKICYSSLQKQHDSDKMSLYCICKQLRNNFAYFFVRGLELISTLQNFG